MSAREHLLETIRFTFSQANEHEAAALNARRRCGETIVIGEASGARIEVAVPGDEGQSDTGRSRIWQRHSLIAGDHGHRAASLGPCGAGAA